MDQEGCKENLIALPEMDDPGSPTEPEAKKLKVDVVECIDLTDEDALNVSSITASGRKVPRTPKLSKEEREAERLRKLEIKKQKEEEREKARLEKEKAAEEKRLEREKKEKEREEKRREEEKRKEEKRKAEEERAEKKRKEEEEKQKKREELALRKKEEDERKEAKRREEEEKKFQKRKEEEAQEGRKRKASARFIGFFNRVEKKYQGVNEEDDDLWYKPFQVKPGMTLAPLHQREILPTDADILTQLEDVTKNTYLDEISKKRTYVCPRKIELRAKLFQFHDNYRPPYYGTWRKKDRKVKCRKPWLAESSEIDYDVDSDVEWEDEPSDAEECRSDEEDPETDEADSDQGDFFVEPGYLSDGEGADEESDQRLEADNPEARAARLAARANEWKQRVLKKDKVLVPVILAAGGLPAGMRQHPMSNVRKLNELVHECQVQLALFRHATQGIGTSQDGASLRREVETAGRACLKACEAAKNCVLPQLRHEGVEFTRHASQFIGCVAAYVVEMKRCVALERTFPAPTEPSITPAQIANMESMLENLENLITVHFSTSESSPTDKVTPRRRRATSCRPQCMCSNLKTSYA